MESCKELFLDDIVAVYPLAVGVLTHLVPETVVKDVVSTSELGYDTMTSLRLLLASKVRLSDVEEGVNTCLLSEPPILKVTTERSVSGYYYTMTLEMKLLYDHETEKAIIRKLEWEGNDYVLERQDGSLSLLRYFAPAQRCTREKNDEGVNLTLTMRNVTGVQEIVPDESDE